MKWIIILVVGLSVGVASPGLGALAALAIAYFMRDA
jgi:hypothetical protein